MKFEKIKELEEEKFRRLTGVKRGTFEKMVKILEEADRAKKRKGGRKNKMSIENMLLMALEYNERYLFLGAQEREPSFICQPLSLFFIRDRYTYANIGRIFISAKATQ